MITCKDTVRFSVLRPYIWTILDKLDWVFTVHKAACVITCGTEAHGPDDPHTNGFAVDLRSKHLPAEAKPVVLDELRRVLGGIYTVILENEGEDTEHFHIQIRKDLWRSLK